MSSLALFISFSGVMLSLVGCTTVKAMKEAGKQADEGDYGIAAYTATMGVAMSAIYDVVTIGGTLSPEDVQTGGQVFLDTAVQQKNQTAEINRIREEQRQQQALQLRRAEQEKQSREEKQRIAFEQGRNVALLQQRQVEQQSQKQSASTVSALSLDNRTNTSSNRSKKASQAQFQPTTNVAAAISHQSQDNVTSSISPSFSHFLKSDPERDDSLRYRVFVRNYENRTISCSGYIWGHQRSRDGSTNSEFYKRQIGGGVPPGSTDNLDATGTSYSTESQVNYEVNCW